MAGAWSRASASASSWPAQNDRAAADEALKAGGFTSVDEEKDAVLPRDELVRLERELEAYRVDYAETLAACQKAER